MDQNKGLGTGEERRARILAVIQSALSGGKGPHVLDQLDDYIAAQLASEAYLARFSDVAIHLDACLDCADAYARLYELEIAEATNSLPSLTHDALPDLSFLTRPQAPQSASDLVAQLRAAVQFKVETVRLQLTGHLLPLLQPLSASPITRAPADNERYHKLLLQVDSIVAQDVSLPFVLTAYEDAHQPQCCLIEVVVTPPGESWPNLGGRSVTLDVNGATQVLLTDAWGGAAFPDIRVDDLAQISVEVSRVKPG